MTVFENVSFIFVLLFYIIFIKNDGSDLFGYFVVCQVDSFKILLSAETRFHFPRKLEN